MKIEPYLFFEGRCDEAIEFYRTAIGAEVTARMRYKDGPGPGPDTQGSGDKVMHANLRIGDVTVMVSDGLCSGQPKFQGFSLCLLPPDETRARQMFDALAAGGEVQMPLGKTFFSPYFGMIKDRFGVSWMILVMS
jgi:PhnB protein